MEALAKELIGQINWVCSGYHYHRQIDVIDKVQEINEKIQEYVAFFLQGNIFGIEEEEYAHLSSYVLQVVRDYSEAFANQDMVLMIDTLDYGLRELLNLVIDTEGGEERNE